MTNATPAEIEIGAIVGTLLYCGHMELTVEQVAALEDGQYKDAADWFQLWAQELLLRRMTERLEANREAMAAICEAMADDTEARPPLKLVLEWPDNPLDDVYDDPGDWPYSNHTGGAGVTFGDCPP